MKRFFIINPASGGGMSLREFESVRRHFRNLLGEFHHVITKSAEDISTQARRAAEEGTDQLVVLGGDGTINSVINGLFEKDHMIRPSMSLAIAKWGTGSDYHRTLQLQYSKANWKTTVMSHAVRAVDVGRAQFSDGKVRYFLNMASFGMSAKIARAKESNPFWVPKALHYVVPSFKSFFDYEPCQARILVDGKEFTGEFMAVFVAKGVFAGGGMRLGGKVELDSGTFDIKLFRPMKIAEMFARFPKLYLGHFDDIPEIEQVVGKRLEVRSARPQLVEGDGEVLGETDVSISLLPSALSVCFPLP